MLIAFLALPPFNTEITSSATDTATLICASSVDAPRCGVMITLSRSINGLSNGGSFTNTSSAAPATLPLFTASARASSLIMPPRAQLMIRTPSFITANCSASMMFRVSLMSGVCTVIKSARSAISLTVAISTPNSCARSSEMNGSYASMVISSPCARLATSVPMRPSPTTPKILPLTSVPMNSLRSHFLDFRDAFACGTFLVRDIIIAMVCSAAESMLPSGALTTIIPFCVAASISMLSTPTPALPMIFNFSAASITTFVTCVPLRMTSASASLIFSISSSSERPVEMSTVKCSSSFDVPSSDNGSLTNTFIV